MRKISLILIVVSLTLFSCSSGEHWKLRLEIPGQTKIDLADYERIVITDFLIKEKTKAFNINKEIRDYLSFELEKKADIKVALKKIVVSNITEFDKPDFWKKIASDMNKNLYLTGRIEYTEEIRKALIHKDKRRFEDPFPQEARLMQRRFYTLTLDLYLINAESGKIVYKRTFKESKAYKNPNQTAYFAFFELIQGARDKLFLDIQGGQQIQERYLIK
jgi:hypothetical protein